MSKCWAAVILKWAEEWVGTDLVAWSDQESAGVITANVIAERGNRVASAVKDVGARAAGIQYGVAYLKRARDGETSSTLRSRVAADRAIFDGSWAAPGPNAATLRASRVVAHRAVTDRKWTTVA